MKQPPRPQRPGHSHSSPAVLPTQIPIPQVPASLHAQVSSSPNPNPPLLPNKGKTEGPKISKKQKKAQQDTTVAQLKNPPRANRPPRPRMSSEPPTQPPQSKPSGNKGLQKQSTSQKPQKPPKPHRTQEFM
jgi:hypothetical protein